MFYYVFTRESGKPWRQQIKTNIRDVALASYLLLIEKPQHGIHHVRAAKCGNDAEALAMLETLNSHHSIEDLLTK